MVSSRLWIGATEVPLDVAEAGRLDLGHDLGGVVQDEVEVDRRVEPLVEVTDLRAGVQARSPASRRAAGAGQRRQRVGSSDAARWISEYHARTAAQPAPDAGRIRRRRSPTS